MQVYYGVWKDQEVAVKVLMADSAEHNTQMAKEVCHQMCWPGMLPAGNPASLLTSSLTAKADLLPQSHRGTRTHCQWNFDVCPADILTPRSRASPVQQQSESVQCS